MGKRCSNNYLDGKICKKKLMPCIKIKALSTNIAYVNFMLFITNSYYYGPGKIDHNDGTMQYKQAWGIAFLHKKA